MNSPIDFPFTASSKLVSRGLRYDPLRSFDGELITDMEGNVLFEITATYRSILTKESFTNIIIKN